MSWYFKRNHSFGDHEYVLMKTGREHWAAEWHIVEFDPYGKVLVPHYFANDIKSSNEKLSLKNEK